MDRAKILQANVRPSKVTTEETLNMIPQNNYQFALIQEPYCYKHNSNVYSIPGLRALKLRYT
jgi:hypothetical protein